MEFVHPDLIKEKLLVIKNLIYSQKLPIPVWRTRTARYTRAIAYEDYSPWSEMSLGSLWNCPYDGARWFEASITVPESFAGKHLVLELNMGGEGLVSINGEPVGSLAFYHRPDCYGPSNMLRHRTRIELQPLQAGQTLQISVQLNMNYKDHFKDRRYIRYDGAVSTDYILSCAELCVVDDATEGFYYDAQNVFDAANLLASPADTLLNHVQGRFLPLGYENVLKSMNRDAGLATRMYHALVKAMLAIDFYQDKALMRSQMAQASAILKAELENLPAAARGTVFITGFAHLDLVWLWQEKHSVRKAANTLVNTLALVERYPEYIFTFSQPYAFSWIETHYPQLFAKVQEKVASGNIDPVGNLWVEMDCNLSGGESIIRQLLYGRAYYLEKFGKSSDIFLMPDSFGYSAALPQIMAKSGIRYFLTAKLHMNETYRFPYTLFQWEGLDGTRIPTYLMRNAYSSQINAEFLDTTYHRQECKTLDATCMTFGFGDGGGGPDYIMLENARRLQDLPGIPKAKMATLDQYFEEATRQADSLPVWRDELYFDRHRGTYTTQAKIKKYNRQAELALRRTEMAASLRQLYLGIPYPARELETLWKLLLPLQFHDSLPGSSITPVYTDVYETFETFFRQQTELFSGILKDLTAGAGQTEAYWNFLSWDRLYPQGDKVLRLPSMGWSSTTIAPAPMQISTNALENQFFRITLDAEGRMTQLWHKATNRQLLQSPSNILQLYEDPGKATLSAWDIFPEYANKEQILHCTGVELGKLTPTQGSVRLTWQFGNSTVTQDLTIYSDIPRIDFITHADWHEEMHMLKAAFYPAVRASRAAYEVQFGAIERPTHRNTDYDAIRFEVCGHKWADLSQADLGLSLLNDCKYGYDILDNRMRITLLRSPIEPDCTADRGEHTFTYSLYPHAFSWENGGTVRAGFELNEPAHTACVPESKACIPECFLSIDHDSVILDTFKQAEDGNGYILRLYEACGKSGWVNVQLAKAVKALYLCDMMEQNNEPAPFRADGFTFETTPYCIHTYRIIF